MRKLLVLTLLVLFALPSWGQDEDFEARMKAAPQYAEALANLKTLNGVDDLDTRVALLKKLDGLVETLTSTYYLAAADVLGDEVSALGKTLRLAAACKDARTSWLYQRYLAAREAHLSLTEIQGTGHGMNMAYTRQGAIPYLAVVDLGAARKEAQLAARQINTHTFEATIYLDIVSDQAMRAQPQLSDAQLQQLLGWASACIDSSKRSDLHVEASWKDAREYFSLCRILVENRQQPWLRGRRLIEQFMLARNQAYARIFPFDALEGSQKLTGLPDLVGAMEKTAAGKTLEYARRSLVPRLHNLRYIYLADLDSAKNHYPYSDLEVANKIFVLDYFSALFEHADRSLSRRLAEDAAALLPRFKAQQKSALFQTDADVLCLTRLRRFDPSRAQALASKYGVILPPTR